MADKKMPWKLRVTNYRLSGFISLDSSGCRQQNVSSLQMFQQVGKCSDQVFTVKWPFEKLAVMPISRLYKSLKM